MEKNINKNFINIFFALLTMKCIYLQLVQKSTLSLFDDKPCFIDDNKNKRWN